MSVPDNLDKAKTRRKVEEALRKEVSSEQLVNIARELGVELAFLPEPPQCCCGHRDPDRPNFGPDQVRCPHQLRKGLHYFDVHSVHSVGGYRQEFIVVKEPYYSPEYKGWWMKVKYLRTDTIWDASLQDRNIFPYHKGNWNTSNWVAFTEESRPRCYCHHHHCGCCS